MAKTYKLWIEIEEHDEETDEYRNITQDGAVMPVDLGVFTTVELASEAAEALGHMAAILGESSR